MRIVRALLTLALLVCTPLTAAAAGLWRGTDLTDIGLTDAMRQYTTAPSLRLTFPLRQDRVLTAARVSLTLDESVLPEDFDADELEILVNDVLVGRVPIASADDQGEPPMAAIPAELVGDSNALTIRFAGYEDCQRVPRGAWNVLAKGSLQMQAEPLPLPNDLGILPLPFLDSHFDRDATVHVAFFAPLDGSTLKAASLVASYFGLQGGSKLRFDASIGELPDTSAVVLATRDSAPKFLRHAASGKDPVLMFRNHPEAPGGNEKLLVLLADSTRELEQVASHLALRADELAGPAARLPAPAKSIPQAAYSAPRWLPPGRDIRFSDIEGGDALSRHPITGGANTLQFRLAPDLFTWPDPTVAMEVRYEIAVPPDLPAPTLHAELNGQYLGELPPPRREHIGEIQQRTLQVPTELLHGYNELSFHADFTAIGDLCGTDVDDEIHVGIRSDSVIHLEGVPHFARMPDVSSFVYDGFPFTRFADLSDTVLAVSDEPATSELGMTLSVMAHLAALTGYPATGLRVETASALQNEPGTDADVLIVSEGRNNTLVRNWALQLPVGGIGRDLHPQRPATASLVLDLASGWTAPRELERAQKFARHVETPMSAVMGIESPLHAGRSAVVISLPADALSGAALRDYLGDAQAEYQRSDLLLTADSGQAMFKIAPGFDTGEIDVFSKIRWTLYQYWGALFPLLLLAAPMALVMQQRLRRRAQRRLETPGRKS